MCDLISEKQHWQRSYCQKRVGRGRKTRNAKYVGHLMAPKTCTTPIMNGTDAGTARDSQLLSGFFSSTPNKKSDWSARPNGRGIRGEQKGGVLIGTTSTAAGRPSSCRAASMASALSGTEIRSRGVLIGITAIRGESFSRQRTSSTDSAREPH